VLAGRSRLPYYPARDRRHPATINSLSRFRTGFLETRFPRGIFDFSAGAS
jgi:hypothetical protein